jgi:hypothetical protein
MDLSMLFKRAGKVAAENSPAILTALGVSGTLTTAYLAAKAGFKSVAVLQEAEENKKAEFLGDALREVEEGPEPQGVTKMTPEPLTTREKVEAVWPLYAPAVASAAFTVSAIILAARVSERRNAALAAAYTTVRESYTEYRAKNVEKIGKKKEQEVRDEIAQDRINRKPVSKGVLLLTKKGGETLIQDAWTGRFFTSSKALIDKAVNDFNSQLIKNDYGSLSEFWNLIGIPSTTDSDYIGWSVDQLLEIDWTGVIDENEEPALSFTFKTLPHARFASTY